MSQLGYLTRTFDATEQSFFSEAWSLLSLDSVAVNLSNLITFLKAIDKMVTFKCVDAEVVAKSSKYGALTENGIFVIRDDSEANAVFKNFALFSKNKQLLSE